MPVQAGFTRPFINHIIVPSVETVDGSCDYKVTLRHVCHAVGRSSRVALGTGPIVQSTARYEDLILIDSRL